MNALLIFALFLAAFCMVGNRLSRSMITAPQIFLALGVVFSQAGVVPGHLAHEALHMVAEITLVVLLFLDAAKIDVRQLRSRFVWPARMLLIGLPLCLVIGTGAAFGVMPALGLAGAALVAAILAPTDAALGQPVVSNPAMPDRPRQALIVESGLNDGLALPLILMLVGLSAPVGGAPDNGWLMFTFWQLTLGPAVGVGAGLIAGRALIWAKQTGWTSDTYEGIAALAIAGVSYMAATEIGGNGFIAAFTAGLAFGAVVRGRCAFVYEFTESEGQLLSWASFFLMGLVLVPEALAHLTWQMAVMILISLFVVRPLAIWLSLIGTDAQPITRLFFGWFGPRGLATALFALLVVEKLDPEFGHTVLMIAVNAVWISALLHGVTAAPGAAWYARRMQAAGQSAETTPHHDDAITGPREMDGTKL